MLLSSWGASVVLLVVLIETEGGEEDDDVDDYNECFISLIENDRVF